MIANQSGGNASGGRLKFVDGLRGIAAVMVAVYHLAPLHSLHWLTGRGYLGVSIFFVLSGFVIASVLADTPVSTGYFGRFVARRCVRLDIPYWVNICLAIALGRIVVHFGAPERIFPLKEVLAQFVYLQDILGYGDINQVYWTLCLEIQFYLALIIFIWGAQALGASARSRAFQLFILATVIASAICDGDVFHVLRGTVFFYWWSFALGAIAWWAISGRAPKSIFFVAFAATMSLFLLPHEDHRLVSGLTALALFAAATWDRMDVWLASAPLQFLGRISYSLYLFHPYTGAEVEKLAERHVGIWPAFVIGMVASILSAWIVYLLIEKPAIRLSRRIRLKGNARAGAGGCHGLGAR